MDDHNTPPSSTTVEYSQREIQKIWNDIQSTLETLKEIDVVLTNEIKNAKASSYSAAPGDNIIHIVPSIKIEFDIIRPLKSIKIDKLVEYYSKWSEELYTTIILNTGKLKNKRLTRHMLETHSIVSSLTKIIENYSSKK